MKKKKEVKVKVSLTKELDDIWGIEDLIEDFEGTKEDLKEAIINLIMEDMCEFLDNAEWKVEME